MIDRLSNTSIDLTIMYWNDLTFLWNDLTLLKRGRSLALLWNELTMERSDRIPFCSLIFNKGIYISIARVFKHNGNTKISIRYPIHYSVPNVHAVATLNTFSMILKLLPVINVESSWASIDLR